MSKVQHTIGQTESYMYIPYVTLKDNAFSQAGNLRQYLEIHSGKKYNKCNLCDFASYVAGHLKKQSKTDSEEKLCICNQCDFDFPQAGTLRTHFKTHRREKAKQK